MKQKDWGNIKTNAQKPNLRYSTEWSSRRKTENEIKTRSENNRRKISRAEVHII